MDILKKKIEEFDDQSIDSIWMLLKTCIKPILTKPQYCKSLPLHKLNNLALRIVLLNHGEIMYAELKEMVTTHLKIKVKEDVLKSLNNNFLQAMVDIWNNYNISINIISNMLLPMEVNYVEPEKVESFAQMSFFLFYEWVYNFGYIRDHFRMAFLNMVKFERNGEIINRSTIESACEMLIKIGKTDSVYKIDIEQPFLKLSARYFKVESQTLLKKGNAGVYIKSVDSIMVREEKLAKVLNTSTTNSLLSIMKTELIVKNSTKVIELNNSGILYMMENDKLDDLARMYKFMMCIDDGLKKMSDYVSQYLRELGRNIVLAEDMNTSDGVNCIQALLDLKNRFNYFLVNSFMNNEIIKKTIDADFEYFLNLNSELPDYLSVFIDEKLKSAENDVDIVLTQVKVIIGFLKNKDKYENVYEQMIKSLLINKSDNNDGLRIVTPNLKTNSFSLPFAYELKHLNNDTFKSNTSVEVFKENGVSATNNKS